MLTSDRSGGALNARQMVATLGLAETLTPARRWSESRPGACPCPWGDPIRHLRCQPCSSRPPHARLTEAARGKWPVVLGARMGKDVALTTKPAGRLRAGRTASMLRALIAAGGSAWAAASSAPGLKAGDASRRSKTAASRCEMMRPDRGRRRLKACDRLMRGFEQVTKERSVWRL